MLLEKNISAVKERIKQAALISGRKPEDIKLLAVTKTQNIDTIQEALENGIKFIAENKVQEAEKKIPLLRGKFSEFHFIGHLQSNKIKHIIKLKPVLIHSIDKYSTAKKLNTYLAKNSLTQDILIEVNTSGEASKFGIKSESALQLISSISQLENIRIKGLMTIGLFTSDESKIRGCFKELRKLSEQLKKNDLANTEMKYLSMGMTNDFEIAIEEGANIVRIGTAVFGTRNY
ncbi:MAG: YggS family pyridoxal phosphate-dependent enzyme [Candidatus Cloacimonetes bacterium]|nr:YggS family pyridoxal phosphate-dependent enzyme [Candidatus Cloacimonadota bacterium]